MSISDALAKLGDEPISRRALTEAVKAYEAARANGDSSAESMRAAFAAALPHLRVQETPPGRIAKAEALEEEAERAKADAAQQRQAEDVDPSFVRVGTTSEAEMHFWLVHNRLAARAAAIRSTADEYPAPHPRPVVDREAIWRALYNVWQNPKDRPIDFASEGANAVLALLPTEEGEGS